ncbi:type IX secretion system membrane protein PorP/SprF [Vibrio genomosp. F6]|uniref:conjugal transfer protein TraF n=1 Tax=Vibrio genomosp. F6 TaxID=723172 RepID=UPI0010BD8BB5|nr:conjugal transfer protein TraF [Vibrio genomosp. F6]TKF21216.1 type IX secretion system membrane protein PorP/SprF [Vibrio genomosp. F6]
MKNSTKILISSITLASVPAVAANYSVEARGDAMGGVGTVSASYLTAPFYNPALTAIYRRNDDAGMILPSIGISYNDENKLVDQIDGIADGLAAIPPDAAALDAALTAMDGDSAKLELGGVVAFGIPNKFIAANIFGKAYTETFVTPRIDTAAGDGVTKANNSIVEAVSIGVTEVGISLAKYQTFLNQHLAFGISPKLQRIYTYSYATSFSAYDIGDVRENETAETVFNLDAGALWFYGPVRIGFAAKNLMGRDIETKKYQHTAGSKTWDIGYEYSMRPLYTIGAGIVSDYFTVSVDYDLNEEKRFSQFDDNTQMLRAGFEIDLIRQVQIRGGYMTNLARDTEDTITAGLGISPLNIFEIDVAASYTNEDAMGASINFLATY